MPAKPGRRLLLVVGTGWPAIIKTSGMRLSRIDVTANRMRRDANVVIQIDDEFVGELLEGMVEGARLARRGLENVCDMKPRVGRRNNLFGAKLPAILHDQRVSILRWDVALCK